MSNLFFGSTYATLSKNQSLFNESKTFVCPKCKKLLTSADDKCDICLVKAEGVEEKKSFLHNISSFINSVGLLGLWAMLIFPEITLGASITVAVLTGNRKAMYMAKICFIISVIKWGIQYYLKCKAAL